MSEILEELCSGCEGDECCQIQDDLRNTEYNCPIMEKYSKLDGDAFVYFSILNDIKNHMKNYPNEKDKKYIIGRSYPNSMGSTTQFNSVYFLTDLETWHKKLTEILIPFQCSMPLPNSVYDNKKKSD